MNRYPGIIEIDLTARGEQRITCAQANRLWLPKVVNRGNQPFYNPTDAVVAIRYADSGESDIWAIQNGFRNTESGTFELIYATVLTPGASAAQRLCLMTGVNVTGGYASSDGLSPSIGGGATQETPATNTYQTQSIRVANMGI